jgi:predicted ATPase
MSAPIKQYKKGSINLAIWQGKEFQGKPSYYYTIKKQKFNEVSKQYEDSVFLNESDLSDIHWLVQTFFVNKIAKASETTKKPTYKREMPVYNNKQNVQEVFEGQEQTEANPFNDDESIPF